MSAPSGFAIIPLDLARTPVVSAQAKAVYVALSSHAGEETITIEQLAKEVGTTPEATQRALHALRTRGWGLTLELLAPAVIDGHRPPANEWDAA